MKSIAVVECASSGQMYVDDIIEMGYHPLCIFTPFNEDIDPSWAANVAYVKKSISDKADIIQLPKDYSFEGFINQLNKYEIVCAVPGSDYGIRLTDKLNKVLGLKGNDPDTTYLRCTKAGMDEALIKAGLRHIRSGVVSSVEQVEKFWNDNGFTKAVMKFSEGGGTFGLKICESLDECIEQFKHMNDLYTTDISAMPQILMQEYIGGVEYVINSLSIDGNHKITDIWRYEKILQDDGTLAYDTMILVDRLVPGMQDILQYDYEVLNAVEMKNGFCHTEIKVDDKGPVLIETNARLMGGNFTREYLDEIFGSHMSDITLKSLLNPSFFNSFLSSPYLPRKSALFKFAITPRDVKADLGPFFELVMHLDSYREIVYFGGSGSQEYPRTIDLDTSPFFIRMTNEDYGKLKRDYELVRLLESRYYDLLFATGDHVEGTSMITNVDEIIRMLPLSRKFALISDDKVTVVQFGEQTVSDEWGIYDGAIFTTCSSATLTKRFLQMMRCMNHIRKGGVVIIVPEAYQKLPYGSICAEVMMSVMGFKAAIPPSIGNGVLYGIKN